MVVGSLPDVSGEMEAATPTLLEQVTAQATAAGAAREGALVIRVEVA